MERLLRLPWPDRLGVGVAFLVGLAGLGVGAVFAFDARKVLLLPLLVMPAAAEGAIALPTWLIARTVDFVIGGPQRRQKKRISN